MTPISPQLLFVRLFLLVRGSSGGVATQGGKIISHKVELARWHHDQKKDKANGHLRVDLPTNPFTHF